MLRVKKEVGPTMGVLVPGSRDQNSQEIRFVRERPHEAKEAQKRQGSQEDLTGKIGFRKEQNPTYIGGRRDRRKKGLTGR